MHALARVRGHRLSAAVFAYLAGYLLFYGQAEFVVYVDDHKATNPTAFLHWARYRFTGVATNVHDYIPSGQQNGRNG